MSVLSCNGKLMERCTQPQVFDCLKVNHLLTVSQSGFIPKDSTFSELITKEVDLCNALDKQITFQAVFFDIAKLFDSVWHTWFIRKLFAIGIRDNLLDCFKRYLSERRKALVIKRKKIICLDIAETCSLLLNSDIKKYAVGKKRKLILTHQKQNY